MDFNRAKILSSIIFIFFISMPIAAQADRVDQYIRSEMRAEKIPGLSIAVVKNGKIIKAAGYGLANIELNVPATPHTVYQIASVGKQFTATLILLLAEQGKLNLDDKISKYLPNTPATWQDITIRNLLTHTSGIKEYTATEEGGSSNVNERLDYTDEQLLQIFESYPLDFKPGESWSYSDTGYVILGFIIKKVTGEFYGDLLQQYIFKPLGMNATRVINEPDIIPNRAAGYWLVKGVVKNQEYVSPSLNTTADGSIYSTVLDMAKWDQALYAKKILQPAYLKLLWTPVKLANNKVYPYGMGWEINRVNGHLLIQHSGWWQGFSSFFARFPDDKFDVILLTNLAEADVGKIVEHVVALYEPALLEKSVAEPA